MFFTKLLRVMNLTALILFIAILHVSAHGIAQERITFSGKDVPLEKVFTAIKKQTGYFFLYNAKLLDKAKKVSLNVNGASVEDVLTECLKNQSLDFSIEGKTIFIVQRQEPSRDKPRAVLPLMDIRGRVLDDNGLPVVGATIVIKGTSQGTATDENGYFTLASASDDATLVISSIGFERMEIRAASALTISLKKAMNDLDETVIIAYGTSSRRLLTGSVSRVTAETISKQPVSDPIATLQGRVPGLFITQSSGVPGAAFKVRLRGQNSIANGNDPLYIVDGVPYPSAPIATQNKSVMPAGSSPLNYLNPNDIESIDVLKDADATAIYGSRGANGVILITTKKGKAGQNRVTVNLMQGVGTISHKMDLLTTEQYLTMRHEAFKNDGTDPGGGDFDVNGTWDSTRYTDWQKELIGGHAQYSDAQLSFSGGSLNTQFLLSGDYHRETTVFPGDNQNKKASVLLNLAHASLNKKFRINLSTAFVTHNNNLVSKDYTGLAIFLPPNAPELRNPDGSLNWAESTWRNPLANLTDRSKENTRNLNTNATISYQLLPDLQLRSSFGYSYITQAEKFLSPIASYDPIDQPYVGGQANFSNTSINTWIIEPQLNYRKSFGFGNFDLLAGTTFQSNNLQNTTIVGSNIANDELIENIGSAPLLEASGRNADYRYTAVFGRLSYNYKEKYLLSLTARRDGSSRFGPGRRFGNFGAIGAGWIFSSEPFIRDGFKALSFGKLRASYGTTGNDQTGDYRFLDTYTATAQPYQGIAGLFPSGLFNPDFGWETNKKMEVGLELGFVKDRILFSANYYRNRSSNQLVGYPLPPTAGFLSVPQNLPATVENTGTEFELSTVNIKSKNFTWSSSVNLSAPNNKLVAFPNLEGSSYASTYVVGQSLFIQKLFHVTGVDPQTGAYVVDDVDKDQSLTKLDRTLIMEVGQKYYGGFLNSFQYKGFRLDVLFQFVKQTGNNYIKSGDIPGTKNNQPVEVMARWQNPGDVTSVQRFTQADFSYYDYVQPSNLGVTDASYIRLKNLSLSWQFPQPFMSRLHLQNASVYVRGQNLLTFTDYIGLDPEQGFLQNLPSLRMITGGIQITL